MLLVQFQMTIIQCMTQGSRWGLFISLKRNNSAVLIVLETLDVETLGLMDAASEIDDVGSLKAHDPL